MDQNKAPAVHTTNPFWQLLPNGEVLPFWETTRLPVSEKSSPFGRHKQNLNCHCACR